MNIKQMEKFKKLISNAHKNWNKHMKEEEVSKYWDAFRKNENQECAVENIISVQMGFIIDSIEEELDIDLSDPCLKQKLEVKEAEIKEIIINHFK
jgi:hypothetical protein